MEQEEINRLRELHEALPMDSWHTKQLWRNHGGGQHGPKVETYTIEESAFYRFANDFQRAVMASISLPTLLAQAERVKVLEAALEPFKDFSIWLEEKGPRGTWVGTELDDYRAEIAVPKDLPDDMVVMSVQLELPGGQLSCPIYVEDFRSARTALEQTGATRG